MCRQENSAVRVRLFNFYLFHFSRLFGVKKWRICICKARSSKSKLLFISKKYKASPIYYKCHVMKLIYFRHCLLHQFPLLDDSILEFEIVRLLIVDTSRQPHPELSNVAGNLRLESTSLFFFLAKCRVL